MIGRLSPEVAAGLMLSSLAGGVGVADLLGDSLTFGFALATIIYHLVWLATVLVMQLWFGAK